MQESETPHNDEVDNGESAELLDLINDVGQTEGAEDQEGVSSAGRHDSQVSRVK